MQQKQAIWRLKRKSLNINLLFIESISHKINITFVIMLIFEEKVHSLCDLNHMKCKYINIYLEFCDHS